MDEKVKANCSQCGVPTSSAATDREGLCIGCRYLPKKERERILLNAPATAISATKRRELLLKEARRHKVGEVVPIGGKKLLRVDARSGQHQRWNIKVEEPLLPGVGGGGATES